MSSSNQIKNYMYSKRIIGKGAFSRVYKGLDINNDELVAIKIMDKFQMKKAVLNRLKEEIKLMKDIEHKGIVEFKEFIEDDDHFYMVLEYCPNGDLHHRIRKQAIPENTAKDYMKQIIEALMYLRGKNIIHRDLKPQNILLTDNEKTVKLTDFNFAKELYEGELTNTFCGSPLYMAPEIIEKKKYNEKSDLWSLGLILYEMIYGRNPYLDCINIIDLLEKIKTRRINYNNLVASDECNNFIRELLYVHPERRIDWSDLFHHAWINTNEPKYINFEQDDMMWESINLNEFKLNVVENYNPRSSSIPIKPTYSIKREKEDELYSKSAPSASDINTKVAMKHLWNWMSNSVQGAVDYFSSFSGGASPTLLEKCPKPSSP